MKLDHQKHKANVIYSALELGTPKGPSSSFIPYPPATQWQDNQQRVSLSRAPFLLLLSHLYKALQRLSFFILIDFWCTVFSFSPLSTGDQMSKVSFYWAFFFGLKGWMLLCIYRNLRLNALLSLRSSRRQKSPCQIKTIFTEI